MAHASWWQNICFIIIAAVVQMGSHSKNELAFIILLITAKPPCFLGVHWHRTYACRVAIYRQLATYIANFRILISKI